MNNTFEQFKINIVTPKDSENIYNNIKEILCKLIDENSGNLKFQEIICDISTIVTSIFTDYVENVGYLKSNIEELQDSIYGSYDDEYYFDPSLDCINSIIVNLNNSIVEFYDSYECMDDFLENIKDIENILHMEYNKIEKSIKEKISSNIDDMYDRGEIGYSTYMMFLEDIGEFDEDEEEEYN